MGERTGARTVSSDAEAPARRLALLFDVHAHHPEAWGASASHRFCAAGFSPESNAALMRVLPSCPGGVFSIGLGPQEIQRADRYPLPDACIARVEEQVRTALLNPLLRPKLAAVGEVGLDHHWGKAPSERQRQFAAFERMISLARRHSLPLVIHSRGAEKECIQQLLAAGCPRVMLHCFGGTLAQARQAADAGWLVSIPPVPSKERKRIITALPLPSLVVESDAPYIGKTSADALRAAEMVSRYKKMEMADVLVQTSANAHEFFGILPREPAAP